MGPDHGTRPRPPDPIPATAAVPNRPANSPRRRHKPAGRDRKGDTRGRDGKGGNPMSLRREIDLGRAEEEAGRDRRAGKHRAW
jgi:hypothetical protein